MMEIGEAHTASPPAGRVERKRERETAAEAAGAAEAAATGRAATAARRTRVLVLAVGGLLTCVVLPAAWVVGAWAVGPKLNHLEMPFLTPLLFLVLLIGMPLTIVPLARLVLRADRRLAARAGLDHGLVRARRVRITDVRPAVPVLESAPLPPLPARRRAAAAGLVTAMFAGTLALWLAAPVGSIWVASQLSGTSSPRMWPYALVAVGIAVAMTLGVRLLALLQGAYARVIGSEPSAASGRRSAWLKSYTDERGVRRADRGLEVAMIAAVIVAAVALAVWFFVLADPHGLLPPELQQNS
jgi:MFS family permease